MDQERALKSSQPNITSRRCPDLLRRYPPIPFPLRVKLKVYNITPFLFLFCLHLTPVLVKKKKSETELMSLLATFNKVLHWKHWGQQVVSVLVCSAGFFLVVLLCWPSAEVIKSKQESRWVAEVRPRWSSSESFFELLSEMKQLNRCTG